MGRPVQVVAGLLTAVMAAGCGSSVSSVHHPGPGVGLTVRHGRQVAAPVTLPGCSAVVTVIWLSRSGLGLVGLATRPGGDGTAQLLETTNYGASFHVISPPTGRGTVTDDLSALSRSLIWFDAFNTATARERLYRTSDGGQSWASATAPPHSEAAGSTDSIQFTTAPDGWLADQQPTGPAAMLYRTSDGGATWHPITPDPPLVAPVEDDPASGLWQAGGLVSDRLEHSTDGGHHWHALNLTRARPRAGPRAGYGLPGIFPRDILAPVAAPSRAQQNLLIYASHTQGRSWALISRLRRAGKPALLGNVAEPIPVAFASPATWWALDPGAQPRLFRTTDAGQHWQARTLPAGLSAWQLTAADARHAWALVSTRHSQPYLIITANAGQTWHRASLTPTPAAMTRK